MIVTILLNSLWQGAIVVAIAAIVSAMARSASASTKYALWFAALLALVLVPVVSSLNLLGLVAPLPASAISSPIRAVSGAAAHAASWNWLIAAWCIGVAFFLARLVYSHARLAQILHQAAPATDLGVNVVLSHDVTIPIAAGFLSPVVILPASLPGSMDAAELQQIIEHECAHIRRGDILTNLVQRAIEALFFFNPFAYVIGAQLLREREVACDDVAVAKTGEPDSYATSLMHLAQSTHRPRTALLSPSAVGSGHALVGRIAYILDGKSRSFKINIALIALGSVAFVGLAYLFASNMRAQTPALPAAKVASSAKSQSCVGKSTLVAITSAMQPVFPDNIRNTGIGQVSALVEVTVGANGQVLNPRVYQSSGNAAIDQATLTAATASTYTPATLNCKPVAGAYMFRAEFAPG